ncbi:Protein bric-a-brac 2 [Nymphon striatum]|nr:Protein bric-a-brac 2 [Nymphon striatum]
MESQQFCLRWNNHQSNMLNVFGKLLSRESLVDVTLVCCGELLKAHKVLLSSCSELFEDIFLNNPCQHPVVVLKDIKGFAESLKVKGLTEMSETNDVTSINNKKTHNQNAVDADQPSAKHQKIKSTHAKQKKIEITKSCSMDDEFDDSTSHVPNEKYPSYSHPNSSECSNPIKQEPKDYLSESAHEEIENIEMSVHTVESSKLMQQSMDNDKFVNDSIFVNGNPKPERNLSTNEKPMFQRSLDTSHQYVESYKIYEDNSENSETFPEPLPSQSEVLSFPKDSGIYMEPDIPCSSSELPKNTSGKYDGESNNSILNQDKTINLPVYSGETQDITTNDLYDSWNSSTSSKSEYPCLKCSKTFFSRQNLNRHINALHVGVRYQCEFCDTSLTQLDNLVRHKRIRHGIIALQNNGSEEKQ